MSPGIAIAGAGFGPGFQGAFRSVVPLVAPHQRAGVLSVLFTVSYLAMGVPLWEARERLNEAWDLVIKAWTTHEPFASRFSTSYAATKASVAALPAALSLGSIGMKNGAPSRSCCTMPQTPEKSGAAPACAHTARPIDVATAICALPRRERGVRMPIPFLRELSTRPRARPAERDR